MEFPETVKKGLSKARGEFKRLAEGMASDGKYFETDNIRTYHQGAFYTHEVRYNLVRPVDILRRIPMAHQQGNNRSYSERERLKMQQGDSNQAHDIEMNMAPYPVDDPRIESRPGEFPYPHYHDGRPGRLVFVPDEPREVWVDAPQDPHENGPKEGSHEGQIDGASRDASEVPADPINPGAFYQHPSATVDHASDIVSS